MPKHMLETALELCLQAHTGQRDLSGAPYILHPLRVMQSLETEDERAAALLHDVVEDSPLTAKDIADAGIPKHVVEAVVCLTKVKNEPYDHYLERVYANELARKVKLADLADNMRLDRLVKVTDRDRSRQNKYEMAHQRLSKPKP